MLSTSRRKKNRIKMKYFFCAGLIFTVLVVEAVSEELPSSFRTCRRSMPNWLNCVENAAHDAAIALASGMKSFKILPLEPLSVDSITIGKLDGPISIQQSYKNVKLHGFTKNFKIYNGSYDEEHNIMRYTSHHAHVDFIADYTIDGKILLLPMTGSGSNNITMLDVVTNAVMYCENEERDGETYVKVKKYGVKFWPTKVMMQFDNLFNGDKILGEQMNKFLNENADILFNEFKASFEETFGLVFAKIANAIFSRVPMNKLFPD